MKKNLLMISGDSGIAFGKHNIFFEMLKEFSKYFDHIDIITSGNGVGRSFTIHGNVQIHPNGLSRILRGDFWLHSKFAYEKAVEINKIRKLDLVISHVIPPFFPATKAAIKISKHLKIPHFAEVMHIPGYPKAEGVRQLFERKAMLRFVKKNAVKFKRIRVINENDSAKYLIKCGVSENKIIYIPAFYLDFETFKPMPKIKKNMGQFVYSGRFESNKNIFAMLRAFKKVIADFPDSKLKMVGDGTLFEKVKKFVNKYGLKKNVEILGWLKTQKDLAKVYNESAALIMPSLSEGGPRVTLEAMACCTVVLSTRVGIMPSVIKDGKNGFFIDWSVDGIAKQMRKILNSGLKINRIAGNGRQAVLHFEYTKAIKNYAESYLKLL